MKTGIACVVVLVVLSGCASAPAHRSSSATAETDGLVATKDTGLLRGVVVDEAIRPVAGAHVTLSRTGWEGLQSESGLDGRFGFDALQPGSYVIEVNRTGFFTQTTTAAVEAGIADPPYVRVLLQADVGSQPYVTAIHFAGFIECAVRGGTGGANACELAQGTTNLTEDRSQLDVAIDFAPSWVQWELVWNAGQPLSDQLGFHLLQHREDGDDQYMGIYPLNMGKSPLLMAIDGDGVGHCATCVEKPLNMTGWKGATITAMAGELESTKPPTVCSPTGQPCLTGYGVVLNQKFDFFLHSFYRTVPPDGWRFTRDGDPPVR